jgi:cell wall-associated NlpC family hydrolase
MFDFGKSLINMNPDEQKKMLENATPGQRKTALEMGIGFKNQNQQQQRQQKRDAYHDLDRLNTIVENENEAHDFFGKSLVNWQKSVTGKKPSKDATNLKKQFDEYERDILSNYHKEGKQHGALSETLPKIKKDFLQQGHQFALDKLNERSRSVLDKGLQRLAKGVLSAKDEKDVQAHDDTAFDLINKYVLSEAKFDEKDADAMYDTYLSYADGDLEKARAPENEEVPGAKPGFKMEDAEMYAENDTDPVSDAGGKKSQESEAEKNNKLAGADTSAHRSKKAGADKNIEKREWTPQDTMYHARKHVGSKAWSKGASKGNFGRGDNKCNQFVYDVCKENGVKVPLLYKGRNPLSNEKEFPPVAADWVSPDSKIEGWSVVENPQPGDIAAENTHVGIVSKNGKTISASSAGEVIENDWGFRDSQKGKTVFWRYVGKKNE